MLHAAASVPLPAGYPGLSRAVQPPCTAPCREVAKKLGFGPDVLVPCFKAAKPTPAIGELLRDLVSRTAGLLADTTHSLSIMFLSEMQCLDCMVRSRSLLFWRRVANELCNLPPLCFRHCSGKAAAAPGAPGESVPHLLGPGDAGFDAQRHC